MPTPAQTSACGPSATFILGAPRSGTSLLYKALCLHPHAAWISNWQRRLPRLPQAALADRLVRHTPAARTRAWFSGGSDAYVYGPSRSLVERITPMPVEGEPVFTAAGVPDPDRESVPDAAPPDAARALRRLVEATTRAAGGSVFVSKRIAHNRRIAWLASALPEARFVVLHRDGRAVASSLARVDWWPDEHLWWAGGIDATEWERRHDGQRLVACARHWREEVGAIERGLELVDADRVLTVRYEDLVGDPRHHLAGIGRFAGLPASSSWSVALDALSFPDRNDGWRARLGDDGEAIAWDEAGDQLRSLGYEDERR